MGDKPDHSAANRPLYRVALPRTLRHDLLNDISAILGYAGLLVELAPESLRDYAQRIVTAATHAQDTVQAIPRAPRWPRLLLVGDGLDGLALHVEGQGWDVTVARASEAAAALRSAPNGWDAALVVQARIPAAVLRALEAAALPFDRVDTPDEVGARLVDLLGRVAQSNHATDQKADHKG